MKSFRQFIFERLDVDALALEAREIVNNIILTETNRILKHIEDYIYNGTDFKEDHLDHIIDKWRREFGTYYFHDSYIRPIQKAFQKLITEHVEARFGKIVEYDADGVRDGNLWYISNILVGIKFKAKTIGVGGYFISNPSTSSQELPADVRMELEQHNKKSGAVAIAIYFSETHAKDTICEDVAQGMADTGEAHYHEFYSEQMRGFITSICDTFAHECEHLFQFIEQNKKQNTTPENTFKRSMRIKAYLGQVLNKEVGTWSEADWNLYLSHDIEIDAHATSVAAHIIQITQGPNRRKDYILDDITECIQSIAYLYGGDSKSFNFYTQYIYPKIKENQKYAKIWNRFLKKIYLRLDAYRAKLKQQIADEAQKEKEYWEKHWS